MASFSPPTYNGSRTTLNKAAFRKTVAVLGLKVTPARVATVLKSPVLKPFLLDVPRVAPITRRPNEEERIILLNVAERESLSQESLSFINQEGKGLVEHKIELDYNYWTASDVIQAILPEELRTGAPVGFAATGHIAHLNLNDEYLPYKNILGQIFLDKNPTIKTVVNKLDSIDNQFRVFKMELLAGESTYEVKHRESDCNFTLDFSQVYWNSRLQTEHRRLVSLLQPEDVLADVFAGVGPFALPAAKKGCAVLANDLNPHSFRYLERNIEDNGVGRLVRASCEDGRIFIRGMFRRVAKDPFPAYSGPPLSKKQEERLRKQGSVTASQAPAESQPRRNKLSHVVMNLPDSAIEFLDAFRGVLSSDERSIYGILPLIHCYCFTRELELEAAEKDIRQRVEDKLGHGISEDVGLHLVRSVAPGKEMYCVTFRLPPEVAFG